MCLLSVCSSCLLTYMHTHMNAYVDSIGANYHHFRSYRTTFSRGSESITFLIFILLYYCTEVRTYAQTDYFSTQQRLCLPTLTSLIFSSVAAFLSVYVQYLRMPRLFPLPAICPSAFVSNNDKSHVRSYFVWWGHFTISCIPFYVILCVQRQQTFLRRSGK